MIECKGFRKPYMATTIQTLPAPALGGIVASGGWQREHEAFLRLRPELMARHLGEYVVVHNGQVVASGKDDVTLALEFFARHGNVPVHIGLVAAGPEALARIPHYRDLESGGAGA